MLQLTAPRLGAQGARVRKRRTERARRTVLVKDGAHEIPDVCAHEKSPLCDIEQSKHVAKRLRSPAILDGQDKFQERLPLQSLYWQCCSTSHCLDQLTHLEIKLSPIRKDFLKHSCAEHWRERSTIETTQLRLRQHPILVRIQFQVLQSKTWLAVYEFESYNAWSVAPPVCAIEAHLMQRTNC